MYPGSEPLDVPFLIRLIYDAIGRASNQELKPIDLTYSQSMVLACLRLRQGKPASVSEIQEFMEISHPTALGLVRRLEKKGFVHIVVDPQDRRARLVILDEEKEKMFAEGERRRFLMEKRLLQGLSDEEQAQFRALLTKVYHNVIE